MITVEIKFFRGNPQLKNGGYETTRTVSVKSTRSIAKKVREIKEACCYGSMEYLGYTVKE